MASQRIDIIENKYLDRITDKFTERDIMRADVHPNYKASTVTCSCGNTFQTRSTVGDIKVEICSNCHPFYTGTQKLVDTAGRVEKFRKKYEKFIKSDES